MKILSKKSKDYSHQQQQKNSTQPQNRDTKIKLSHNDPTNMVNDRNMPIVAECINVLVKLIDSYRVHDKKIEFLQKEMGKLNYMVPILPYRQSSNVRVPLTNAFSRSFPVKISCQIRYQQK